MATLHAKLDEMHVNQQDSDNDDMEYHLTTTETEDDDSDWLGSKDCIWHHVCDASKYICELKLAKQKLAKLTNEKLANQKRIR